MVSAMCYKDKENSVIDIGLHVPPDLPESVALNPDAHRLVTCVVSTPSSGATGRLYYC